MNKTIPPPPNGQAVRVAADARRCANAGSQADAGSQANESKATATEQGSSHEANL